MSHKTELIVALDVDSLSAAQQLVEQIGEAASWYKVGKQLFTREGPAVVRHLADAGKQVFLDLKFHDIPNTVHQAVRSSLDLGARMVNVHASGGLAMLEAAAEARQPGTWVIAVTVLTSMDRPALAQVGVECPVADQVKRLAVLTQQAGLDGVVASGHESALIRDACGPEFVQVIPGIRPASATTDDQKRVMTPADAADAGAHFIVVGRPITQAADPAAAAAAITAELREIGG